MVVRFAKRLRLILHDVTEEKPRYMSSFVVDVAELPESFLTWIKELSAGQLGKAKRRAVLPPIAGKKPRTGGVKGGRQKMTSSKAKGGK